MIKKETLGIPSTDGVHTLHATFYHPQGEVRGIFHVLHGMTDYTLRYEELLTRAAERGYLAFGFDLLGHGQTATEEERGFFGEKRGDRILVSDLISVVKFAREKFGQDKPYYLLGHSMGSFIARVAVAEGLCLDGLLLVGSAGGNPAAPFGVALARLLGLLCGKKHVSPFLEKMIFSDYDKTFPGDYKNRWITVDTENLIRYKDDPLCTFPFTVSALGDLILLNMRANSRRFFKKCTQTPTLLLSGADDPVGGFGKGVLKVHSRLTRRGAPSRIRIFEGYRHEILQDFCKAEVTEEIFNFMA